MKTELLEGLGLSKDVIDKVMAENGKDVEAEKAKTAAKVNELATANQTIAQLQETVKKYDGKDFDKLQKDLDDLQEKYDTDIASERIKSENLQKEYGLKEDLKAIGVIDPEYLIYKHGGIEKFAFGTDGKPIGLADIVKPYKESSPHLFGSQSKPAMKTGISHQGGGEGNPDKKDEVNAAFRSFFGKE